MTDAAGAISFAEAIQLDDWRASTWIISIDRISTPSHQTCQTP